MVSSGGGIARSVHPSKWLLAKEGCQDLILSVTNYRYELLKKYHGRYFFKFFGTEIKRADLSWFHDRYDWIFVERRNLFEQLLSVLISTSIGRFFGRRKLARGSDAGRI